MGLSMQMHAANLQQQQLHSMSGRHNLQGRERRGDSTWNKYKARKRLADLHTGSSKTLGTILHDPIVPSSVGQVGLSGYLAIFSSQSAR